MNKKKKIKSLNWKIENLSSALQQKTGKLEWIGIKNFIKNCTAHRSTSLKIERLRFG